MQPSESFTISLFRLKCIFLGYPVFILFLLSFCLLFYLNFGVVFISQGFIVAYILGDHIDTILLLDTAHLTGQDKLNVNSIQTYFSGVIGLTDHGSFVYCRFVKL